MSVVNDVLTDLHKRRSQKSYQDCLPFISEHDLPDASYLSRYILGAILLCTLGYAAYFYVYSLPLKTNQIVAYDFTDQHATDKTARSVAFIRSNQLVDDHHLPSSLPSKEISTETIENKKTQNFDFLSSRNGIAQKALTEDTNQISVTKNDSVNTNQFEAQSVSISPLEKKVVNVTQSEKVSLAKLTNASKSLDVQVSRSNETRIAHRTKDEEMLKQLMLNQPEKVWPYIQKILPQSSNKVGLMALGAQGEQRSHQYDSALELYQTLSQVEPRESKWRVGAAISYDALGNKQQALSAYQQSLQLSPLPPALFTFVMQRISILKSVSDE